MSKIPEKLGYIHGVMDALKLNQEDDTVKIIGMIVDVLNEMSSTIERIESDQMDLNDYVESIDDDLADLEMQYGDDLSGEDGDDDQFDFVNIAPDKKHKRAPVSILRDADEDFDDDFDEDEFDEDDEDAFEDDFDDEEAETEFFIGCVCPECGRFFSVANPDSYPDDQKFECPFCKAHVEIKPFDPSSVPAAKPVQE